MLAGEDVKGYSTLLKMSLMMYCNFEVGVGKINIFKVLYSFGRKGRRVTKKGSLCTLLIILTILEDPLTSNVCIF